MKRTIFITTLLLALTACGPKLERAVNGVFAAAAVTVDELQRQGDITAEVAGFLRVDIPDGKKVADQLIQDLKAIPQSRPDRRVEQLAAWQKAEVAWLEIVNRGHFALNAKLQTFAARANSLFAAGVQIYGGVSAQKPADGVTVPSNFTEDQADELLLRSLENLRNSLE
jgi:hypothetical protein